MHQRYPKCWQVFFLLFSTHIICQCHLYNVRLYASVLVLSIYLSSSFVHFKNSPEYLKKGTTQASIPFIRFLKYSSLSSSFLFLLRYSFFIFFFHLHLIDNVSFQYYRVFVSFPFSERSDFFLYLVVPFLRS